jgi:hypothetical protein
MNNKSNFIRKIKMRLLFVSAIICLLFGSSDAQVRVHANINLGVQPAWGPSGYDYVDYYYLPDYDVFYYVPTHRFVIWEGGRWIFRAGLPPRFGHVDLYSVHKVIINENKPYLRHEFYRDQYRGFIGKHDQKTIREFHQSRGNIDKNRGGHINNGRGREKVNHERGNMNNNHGRSNGNGHDSKIKHR